MKARFIGDPRSEGEGPEHVECFGLLFIKGEFRDVPGDLAEKIAGHNHFEIEPTKVEAVWGSCDVIGFEIVESAPKPVPETIADLDIPPAPVKRGRKRNG